MANFIEYKIYDIICDSCGKSLMEESGCVYFAAEAAKSAAHESKWKEIDGKHYCPDCYNSRMRRRIIMA